MQQDEWIKMNEASLKAEFLKYHSSEYDLFCKSAYQNFIENETENNLEEGYGDGDIYDWCQLSGDDDDQS